MRHGFSHRAGAVACVNTILVRSHEQYSGIWNVTYKTVVTMSVVVVDKVAYGLRDVGVGEAAHFVQMVEVSVSKIVETI